MSFHQKPNTFVSHVQLNVHDLAQMEIFYTKVLGLHILDKTENQIALSADGKNAVLTLVEQPDFVARPQKSAGMYHFALLLPNRSDLADFVTHLQQVGYPFGASDHNVSEALYLSDLEGNEIEIYIDRPANTWTWQNEQVLMTIDPLNFQSLAGDLSVHGWQGMPQGTIMGHLHLYVSELGATKQFYTEGLGMEIVCNYNGQALFLATGKYHHHIAINTWMGIGAPKAQENQLGMAFYTLEYPDMTALELAIQRLEALGHSVQKNDAGVTVVDPSGMRAQLVLAK